MKASYFADPTLYEQCLTLIDACFPGIKALADKGRRHNADWDKSSIPFIIKNEQQLVAHLGLLPFKITLHGKPLTAAAIHGVCTKSEFRRKGYFKHLMQEALVEIKQHYDFAFLFTDQPYLYEPFGFKVVHEYDFIYPGSLPGYTQADAKHGLRKLNLNNPQDLKRLQERYWRRLPLSHIFNIEQEITIATLNALHEPVFYAESLDVLIVYAIKNKVLYIKDMIATKPYELDSILRMIPGDFFKVILQFIPDNFLTPPFERIPATPECSLMISAAFELNCPYFRYPEPQRC